MLLTHAALAAAVLLIAAPGTAREKPPGGEAKVPEKATALLVIDIQRFYFEGGRLPLERPVEASLKARAALEKFRRLGWPVIHVQHLPEGQSAPDPEIAVEAYRFHPNAAPAAGEVLIGKHHANAFRDTALLETLRRLGVGRVVIAGMQTHMCLEAAARAAADLGFEVVVLHDACSTRALSFGGTEVPAAAVHAATLAALASSYARVVAADEFLAELH